MVRMRKKLSSAVRGIRKQLSTKSSVQVASTQVDAESISPLDSVVAQMNSDVDLEQRRDVDMSTVKEEEEIVDNGLRDDVDDLDEKESKLQSEVMGENEQEEGSVQPSISSNPTETEVELAVEKEDKSDGDNGEISEKVKSLSVDEEEEEEANISDEDNEEVKESEINSETSRDEGDEAEQDTEEDEQTNEPEAQLEEKK